MAILVLGGAGYIGSHMVDRLVEAGQEKVVKPPVRRVVMIKISKC